MANIAIFRINYKSDFILTLNSDAGWMTPFCIKFWTSAPSQAYFVGFDGTTYTHCAPVDGEPTKLQVQFDDHHLPIGDLKFQIGYHFTVADFPTSVEDEVINQASVIIEVDNAPAQVMLDFNGETAPEIQFSLPAYANEAQRIANEEQRIAHEAIRIANEESRIAAETIRQQNEQQRIDQETARVNEFATLKSQSQAATSDANDAATLANQKAQLAADKAALADDAATLANQKAQLAADKAELANAAAQLANDKAALAQQKAEYAQQQGGYAKDQGDYAKNQGDYAKAQGDTAQADHERAEADHGIAVDDHTQAGNDHTRAESDHGIAVDDHTQAGNDHTRAESDHTRAESDHAAVEVYVDSLGAFDISAYHATGGVLAKYADLTAAIGTNGANIPEALHKGGMSVKFVQSSDNKYVQYRYMSDDATTADTFTNVANWQGVDESPVIGSKNLAESGSLFDICGGNVDLSAIEKKHISVESNNKWGSSYSWIFPVYEGEIITVTPYSSDSSHAFIFCFVKSVGAIGETVQYATGSSRIWYVSEQTFTAPSDAKYMVMGVGSANMAPTVMVKSAYPSRKEFAELQGWKNIEEGFDDIAQYVEPVNLFNKDSELIKTGFRIGYSGDYTTLSGSSVTHPIKVEVGETYCFKPYLSYYGDAANKIVRVCDENGVLSIFGFSATLSSDNSYYSFTFNETMRQYGEYVCVNVRTSEIGNMIFAKGDSLPAYSDYFEPYWAIKSSALPSDMPLPLNVDANPLYGKKAAFTGDSICYGQGASGGYAKIIGEKNNMNISNIGVAGGTLCSGTNRFCISASVDNMPEDYDYYIVEGGVNDASQEHGETLGVLSSGYNATLDTTTLYGAMESLCKKLQLNFKGKKYGFIFPHNTYGDTSNWNTGWRDAMKICLKKWGIPYIDLSDECAQLRNLDALRIYTANSDGWHPTEEGYRLYYVPKIEAWMKTL